MVVFLMLMTLVFGPHEVWSLVLIQLALLVTLVLLNKTFLTFVQQMRGTLFTLHSVPMLWLQYFYSGFGLGLGILAHFRDRVTGK